MIGIPLESRTLRPDDFCIFDSQSHVGADDHPRRLAEADNFLAGTVGDLSGLGFPTAWAFGRSDLHENFTGVSQRLVIKRDDQHGGVIIGRLDFNVRQLKYALLLEEPRHALAFGEFNMHRPLS